MASRKISAKELVGDIRSGLSSDALCQKYEVASHNLNKMVWQLLQRGLIDTKEYTELANTRPGSFMQYHNDGSGESRATETLDNKADSDPNEIAIYKRNGPRGRGLINRWNNLPREYLAYVAVGVIIVVIVAWVGFQSSPDTVARTPGNRIRQSNDSQNALVEAARNGDVNEVKRLLEKGVNVNGQAMYGYTALIASACMGHVEVVNLLVAKGADINLRDGVGDTALKMASFGGHVEVVEFLLDGGADIRARDAKGYTALICGAGSGHCDVVKILLARGADINAQNSDGYTALMSAVNGGYIEMVKLLLLEGADISIRGNSGETAASIADMVSAFPPQDGRRQEIIGLLSSYGRR